MEIYIGFATTLIGTLSAYFFGRKKEKSEAKKTELDNVESAIKIWRDTAEELSREVRSLREEISRLRDELDNSIKLQKKLFAELERLVELGMIEKEKLEQLKPKRKIKGEQ